MTVDDFITFSANGGVLTAGLIRYFVALVLDVSGAEELDEGVKFKTSMWQRREWEKRFMPVQHLERSEAVPPEKLPEPSTLFGVPLIVWDGVPANELWLVDRSGKLMAKMTNLGDVNA